MVHTWDGANSHLIDFRGDGLLGPLTQNLYQEADRVRPCNGVETAGGKLGWPETHGGKLMTRNRPHGGERHLLIHVAKYEHCS